MLTIVPKKAHTTTDQAIPDVVFRSMQYKTWLSKLIKNFDSANMTDLRRYEATKQMMQLAAQLARDDLQQLPIGNGDENALE
eukprot:8653919-Pyramimonas_sp.AAC.1